MSFAPPAFSDLRAFSSFIPVNNGLFVSFCNFFLSGTKIKMYKIFVYISKNVAVTYERELMPDLLSNSEESSSGFTCNQILNRTKTISENCTQMGGIYLLSVLALQSLAAPGHTD